MMDRKIPVIYQRTFDTLKLKKYEGTDYFLSWKSKGVYNSKRKALYIASLHSIKLSGYRVVTKYDKDLLAVEQNNYFSKIVNVYIVYDLRAWPRNPTDNFTFKNWLLAATSVVKSNEKEAME